MLYTSDLTSFLASSSLGKKNFGLTPVETHDDWGRPVVLWYDEDLGTTYGLYATIEEAPLVTYTSAVSQCQIATDTKQKKATATYDLYVNGKANYTADGITIYATATTAMVGAQGRLVEVYEDEIVVIDTFLAKVDKVTPATYDVASHKIAPSYLYLTVYDAANSTKNIRVANNAANWEYTDGQYVLVNAQTYNKGNTILERKSLTPVAQIGQLPYYEAVQIDVLGVASSFVGAQSYVYSDNSRTVGGAKYASDVNFYLDATNKSVGKTNYTWYMDQYGNLIGATSIQTVYNYGVIANIQWINPELSTGYALATIRYVNGETANVKVASLNTYGLTYATTGDTVGTVVNNKWIVSTSVSENKVPFCGTALYAIEDKGDNTVALNHVGTRTSGNVSTNVSVIGAATIATDNSTVFVVRTTDSNGAYVYTNYTGYTSVPTITGASIIDYVMNAQTGYAKYVYIVGAPDSAVTGDMVHIKALTWFYDNNTRTYTLTSAYVNGVLPENGVVVDAATFAGLTANTVYKMTYTNGVATNATAINSTTWQQVNTVKNLWAAQLTVTSNAGNGVLYLSDGNQWNITNVTPYGGTIKVGSTIVVVAVGGSKTAEAIYVVAE